MVKQTDSKSDTRIQNSILVPVSKQNVIDEYQQSSSLPYAWQRCVWGGTESMLGRFRFGLNELPFETVRSWLDVGCGEVDFFVMAEEQGHRFERLVGVDITPAMIERARSKVLAGPCEFHVADLATLPETLTGFDLISMLGVLQKCGMEPRDVFHALAPRLSTHGTLYLTTKNRLWSKFSEGYLQPTVGHSWYNPYELAEIAEQAGLSVQRLGGLLPREAREVPVDASQTVYLILTRAAA
ncbi:class I SAM-dependent methyltransferase [bacterium]|nr:class I SAM-dependent methyltransferase [bacterium]